MRSQERVGKVLVIWVFKNIQQKEELGRRRIKKENGQQEESEQ